MRLAAVLGLIVACAPTIDGPVERQRAADTADGVQLTNQLAALPGVTHAEVMVRRPARDPLSTTAPASPTTSIVLIVDDRADRSKLETSSRVLARSLVPGVEPAIVVEVGVHRAELAKVGPFSVETSSKPALKATLAIALAIIAALAGWIAWLYRRSTRVR